MLQPKTVVGGRYEIIRKIAEGGMGSVHEAVHLLSRRVVALKLLAPEVARDDAKRQRFLREVSAPAQIGHDGIVEIYDAGFDEKVGLLFVAMELLQGETLRERIVRVVRQRDPSAREALLDVFDRMLEPLAAAHARGIVHRDLKPENVFLHRRRDGVEVVKILDFGIARELDTSTPSVTQTGVAMGTPHYMAPEQAMNAREASFPADVWSLGAMLYEIVSGQPPFPGDAAGSIIAAAVTEAHRPVLALAPDTPHALSELIDRCLAKRPIDRPRDAGALLEALRAARGRAASVLAPLASATPAPVHRGLDAPTGPMTSPMTPMPASPSGPSADARRSTAMPPTMAAPIATSGATGPAMDLARAASPGSLGVPAASAMPPVASPTATNGSGWLWVAAAALMALFGGGTCCLAAAIGLGGMSALGGASAVPRLGAEPIRWDGELTTADRMEGPKFFDTYAFEAAAGQRFTVELSSASFDTILRLGTPSGRSLENDDYSPGMTLDSRLDVPSAESGRYTVHVTSYAERATGPYSVTVRQ